MYMHVHVHVHMVSGVKFPHTCRRRSISYTLSCPDPGIYNISMHYKGMLCNMCSCSVYMCMFEGEELGRGVCTLCPRDMRNPFCFIEQSGEMMKVNFRPPPADAMQVPKEEIALYIAV